MTPDSMPSGAQPPWLSALNPSRDAVIDLLLPHLTQDLLWEIALQDPPTEAEVRRHLQALAHIRDTRQVPGDLDWNPAEVCNLLRWSDSVAPADCRMSLFTSWILVCAYVQPASAKNGYVDDGDAHAIARLLMSATVLGSDYVRETSRFMAWAYGQLRLQAQHRSWCRPLYLLSVFLLLARLPDRQPQVLRPIIEVLAVERAALMQQPTLTVWTDSPATWLLGMETDYNGLYSRWIALTEAAIPAPGGSAEDDSSQLVLEVAGWLG